VSDIGSIVINKILIIDDQFGRCGLGKAFQSAVSTDIMAAYRADRQNLCRNYAIRDLSGDSEPIPSEDALCEGVFCPAQRWDAANKRIENDLDLAVTAVASGWPCTDGSRWALVLLDLAFVQGPLDVFGDPQERTFFGRDTILPELQRRFGDDLPVVVLSSTPKSEQNEAVRRAGAIDFIQRIPNSAAEEGASRSALVEMLHLHGLLPDTDGMMVGRSLATLKMLRQARRAARNARTILLHGEIGTGKNLLARYGHQNSARRDKRFEVFNAANRSAELQADELFGHWKGAFTGAVADAPGIWERCNGGTVLIDEVADIDKSVQQKLMDPIEARQVARMGTRPSAGNSIPVDVLTVLATNQDLSELSRDGSIKRDFLSRIHAAAIELPPLRDRKGDIPELVSKLIAALRAPITLLPEALQALCDDDWRDDNIRGLRRTLEQLSVSHPGQVVTAGDIQRLSTAPPAPSIQHAPDKPSSQAQTAAQLAAERLLAALARMPNQCSRDECCKLLDDLKGAFPAFLAHTLAWSLQLCGDVTNCAKFLSGNPDMDTSAAKQFIKKILKLDVKQQAVLAEFSKLPEAGMGTVSQLVAELTSDSRENGTASRKPSSSRKREEV
jgi:DNA-binding NtrC family response regulator